MKKFIKTALVVVTLATAFSAAYAADQTANQSGNDPFASIKQWFNNLGK